MNGIGFLWKKKKKKKRYYNCVILTVRKYWMAIIETQQC